MKIIYLKTRILYLNDKRKTDWLNVEIDVKNKVYILEKVKISFDDVNIKAVLFNDVSIFNQLILDSKQTVVKQTAKPKKVPKAKETIIENVDETEYENKE